jgi:uncharacterized protein YkwD
MSIRLLQQFKAHLYRLMIIQRYRLTVVISCLLCTIATGVPQLQASTHTPVVRQVQAVVVSHSAQQTIPDNPDPVTQIVVVALEQKKQIITPAPQQTAVLGASSQSQAVFSALNAYRQQHGKAPLSWSTTLGTYAQGRAEFFARNSNLDNHAGFQEMLRADGFNKMGFWQLGENSAYGQTVGPQALISDVYGTSPAHNENQLKSDYTHVGIGISGTATDFVFGGRKR